MTQVQEYLLKLVKEIDEICLANDIDYYVFAGSMLGYERNEGFLPWDDDIDLIMTEENYNKFIQVMRDNPPPNRIFECREDNDEYPLQFGKYMSTDMTGLIRPHSFGNAASGLWIDIILVTPAPTSERRMNLIKKWFAPYCEVDNDIYIEYGNHFEGFYWRYRFVHFLVSVFGKARVDQWADKLFRSYSEDKCTQYLMYHCLYTDYRFFDKKFFEKPVRGLYEGEEVSVNPYNREFSRVLFGDSWMMVPKVEEQAVHTMVIDFDVPYHKYVEDYMPFQDKEKMMKIISETKQLQFKDRVNRRTYVKRRDGLKGLLVNEKIKNLIAAEGLDLVAELDKGNFECFDRVYEEYEGLQFSASVSYWRTFIPLDDDLLYPYLKKTLCYDGKYYTANKFLGMRAIASKAPLSDDLNSLKPLIEVCRKLSVALWDKQDMEQFEEIIRTEVDGKFEEFCIDFELAKLYLKMHKAVSKEDYLNIRQDVDAVLKVLPNQGECIKLLGDIEYAAGDRAKAMEFYEEAEQLTSNGLLLLDIQKKKEAYSNENL